jgi:hypothetical protein
MLFGPVGNFLGVRRLGAATIAGGAIALSFVAAASTGLVPGVAPWVTNTTNRKDPLSGQKEAP